MEHVLATTIDNYGNQTPVAVLTQSGGLLRLWEITCNSSYDHNLGNCLCVNHQATAEYPVSTAEVIRRFGVEALDGFEAPGAEQLVFDAFGFELDELETYLRVAYMLGTNPLPVLRNKTKIKANIMFAENPDMVRLDDEESVTFIVNSRGEISVREVRKGDTMQSPIYVLPCTYTGLLANVDNCDPPAIVKVVDAGAPMSDGCVERYLTTDGVLIDCSIDSVDFAHWFGQDLEEVEE